MNRNRLEEAANELQVLLRLNTPENWKKTIKSWIDMNFAVYNETITIDDRVGELDNLKCLQIAAFSHAANNIVKNVLAESKTLWTDHNQNWMVNNTSVHVHQMDMQVVVMRKEPLVK